MREREIEEKLRLESKKRGGLAMKFVSPALVGVPDRKEYIKDGHAFCKVCHERKDGKVMEFFDNKMIFKIS
ncbi:hypothetical protein ANG6_0551 [Streptococcus anginosus T5]|uniref:Uncharacterized protein n=1 Tax=Streptococcus anginosus T5 TaxID=1163302 RepID=A0AAN4T563_STRAP|nr:hypothetical protein ANG6_0551 [Streptococcus anginosus T5]